MQITHPSMAKRLVNYYTDKKLIRNYLLVILYILLVLIFILCMVSLDFLIKEIDLYEEEYLEHQYILEHNLLVFGSRMVLNFTANDNNFIHLSKNYPVIPHGYPKMLEYYEAKHPLPCYAVFMLFVVIMYIVIMTIILFTSISLKLYALCGENNTVKKYN